MRPVYLDVTRLLKGIFFRKRATGVDRVSLAYVRHYGEDARAVLAARGHHFAVSHQASRRLFDVIKHYYEDDGRVERFLLANALLSSARSRIERGGVLIHTSHSGAEFDRYFRSLKLNGVDVVFMVHDLIPLTHASYCRAGTAQVHERRLRSALSMSSGIIANSRATLDDMTGYAASNGFRVPPAVVAKLAPGTEIANDATAPIAGPYFVMVGTIEPRKNHLLILDVWRRMVKRLGASAPKLVVIGREGWKCSNVIELLKNNALWQGTVAWYPDCPDTALGGWLKHARALLFPSFTEGYGMPVAEALAGGVPVIASDLSVLREYASDIPDYLDPLDLASWQARIMAYSDVDSPERAQQLARLVRFQVPTWEKHFEQVDRLLADLGS